jgi:hypothetical protein
MRRLWASAPRRIPAAATSRCRGRSLRARQGVPFGSWTEGVAPAHRVLPVVARQCHGLLTASGA